MAKKKDCKQYFSWVTADYYQKILTAWPTRMTRSLIDIERYNAAGGRFGVSNTETQKTLFIWTNINISYIKTWTKFYIYYRMSLPEELRIGENWTGDKGLETKLIEWGLANLELLRDSQGLIAEVNI